jgi:hypothetical protein
MLSDEVASVRQMGEQTAQAYANANDAREAWGAYREHLTDHGFLLSTK